LRTSIAFIKGSRQDKGWGVIGRKRDGNISMVSSVVALFRYRDFDEILWTATQYLTIIFTSLHEGGCCRHPIQAPVLCQAILKMRLGEHGPHLKM
jgi:hypothetical protein